MNNDIDLQERTAFEDEVLEYIHKTRDQFGDPLWGDKRFVLACFDYCDEDGTDFLLDYIAKPLWNDEDIIVRAFEMLFNSEYLDDVYSYIPEPLLEDRSLVYRLAELELTYGINLFCYLPEKWKKDASFLCDMMTAIEDAVEDKFDWQANHYFCVLSYADESLWLDTDYFLEWVLDSFFHYCVNWDEHYEDMLQAIPSIAYEDPKVAKKLAMYLIEIDEFFLAMLDKVNPSLYADKEFVLFFLDYDKSRADRIDASLLDDPDVKQALGE